MDQNAAPSYAYRHGASVPADKGTLYYAIREYVIPSVVFVAMIWWLAKNIIIPIIKDPQMVPAYTGWGGATRGGPIMEALEEIDEGEPLAVENCAPLVTEKTKESNSKGATKANKKLAEENSKSK